MQAQAARLPNIDQHLSSSFICQEATPNTDSQDHPFDLHFSGTALFVNLVPRTGEMPRSDFTAGHLGKASRSLTVADSFHTLWAFSGFAKT